MSNKGLLSADRRWVAAGQGGLPPAIAPFSLGVRVGQLVFTAGQAALNEKGEVVGKGDITAQTEKTLENLGGILAQCGASFKDVVKVTIWLTDFKHYKAMNKVYGCYFPEPSPPRACVRADLVWPELLVEIEAIAVVSEKR